MAPFLRKERRQCLKTAAHSLGTVVAITLIGILVGALAGTGLGMLDVELVMIGAATGGVVGSGMLAVSAFFKGFRRKLVAATGRVGRCLNCLAVLGGCSIPVGYYIGASGVPWEVLAQGLGGIIAPLISCGLLIICGVALGVFTGVVFGLIVGLLTVFSLAVVVLVRVSAGFLHSARKGPESVLANLIGGACAPWPIRAAAALMPPEAGRRWRDDFNEARYDYENDQHDKLLRDFLVHAPAVVVWAWIATLQRRVLGVGNSQERRW